MQTCNNDKMSESKRRNIKIYILKNYVACKRLKKAEHAGKETLLKIVESITTY